MSSDKEFTAELRAILEELREDARVANGNRIIEGIINDKLDLVMRLLAARERDVERELGRYGR